MLGWKDGVELLKKQQQPIPAFLEMEDSCRGQFSVSLKEIHSQVVNHLNHLRFCLRCQMTGCWEGMGVSTEGGGMAACIGNSEGNCEAINIFFKHDTNNIYLSVWCFKNNSYVGGTN